MNKNRIRLSESQLRQAIKESVKKVLKENYYDYMDIDPLDYERLLDYDYRTRAEEEYQNIENGVYDDKIQQWANGERDVYDDLDLDIDAGADNLIDVIKDRLYLIDKDAAFKYGRNPSNYRDFDVWYEKNYPKDGNYNVKDGLDNGLADEYWKDKENEETARKLPNTFKKNGTFRQTKNGLISNLNKDVFGTDQEDKRPLHRKGSLNRELDESIRRAIQKVLR